MSALGHAYLDWNATTPPHPDVLAAMSAAVRDGWGNPASVHAAGRAARALVEGAREALASAIGLDARDVLFTSGGTEANNLALWSASALITSRIEHPSVVKVAEELEARGVPVRWLPVPVSGRIEPADVERALAELPAAARTAGACVALMAVNHETGVIQPLAQVFEITRKAGARLHVDAVQALGRLPRELFAHGDSFSVAAHKIRGPKGFGALAFRPPLAPRPLLRGGAQERGLRPGTVDAVSAAGFRAALARLAQSESSYAALSVLRDEVEKELLPRADLNGQGVPRAPHVTNLAVREMRGDELVAALDLEGVLISSGSACSAGTSEASPIITAMVGRERAERSVRISLGEETTPGELKYAIAMFHRVLGARSGVVSSDG